MDNEIKMDNEAFDDYLCWYAHHQPANFWSEKEGGIAEAAWAAAYTRVNKICAQRLERYKSDIKALSQRIKVLERENAWLESHGK